jgi:hypothetical protein
VEHYLGTKLVSCHIPSSPVFFDSDLWFSEDTAHTPGPRGSCLSLGVRTVQPRLPFALFRDVTSSSVSGMRVKQEDKFVNNRTLDNKGRLSYYKLR